MSRVKVLANFSFYFAKLGDGSNFGLFFPPFRHRITSPSLYDCLHSFLAKFDR